jgi:hypothetical protein
MFSVILLTHTAVPTPTSARNCRQEGKINFLDKSTLFGRFVQGVPDEVSPASLGLRTNYCEWFIGFSRFFWIEVGCNIIEMFCDALMVFGRMADYVFPHFRCLLIRARRL